ncbi:MAG: hypothetical protein RRA35_13540 [Desulfomonilia bacterium]|nr:hypothetical protein [Desulfomonilia bacterium]
MNPSFLRISLLCILTLILSAPYSPACDLPEQALALIADASVDPCPLCRKHTLNKAFAILNEWFSPGGSIQTDQACRFMKTTPGSDNELSLSCYPSDALIASIDAGAVPPHLVFRFHTEHKHLVGIADTDFTDASYAAHYTASGPNTAFEGRVRFITYRYGDGPSYNYFEQTHRLVIHCMVEQLIPAKPE